MAERKRVLVGVDAEGCARHSLRAALSLASRLQADLHLLHVVETDERPLPFLGNLPDDALQRRGQEVFERVLGEPPGPEVGLHVRHGHPARELASLAGALSADLLVLGHQNPGQTDWRVESTAAWLVRHAPCPVLVWKSEQAAPPTRLLAAVDLLSPSLSALDLAIDWARRCGGEVMALHVIEPPAFAWRDDDRMPTYAVDAERGQEVEAFRRVLAGVEWHGVPHEALIAEGEPGPQILRSADEVQADLIVIATHGRTGISRMLLGSVAEHVVWRSERPVLVTPLVNYDH